VVFVTTEPNSELQLADIMTFWTGADCPPPCGFREPLHVQFYSQQGDSRRLPSASTCATILWLPRNVGEPDSLWQLLRDAIMMCAGFGKV